MNIKKIPYASIIAPLIGFSVCILIIVFCGRNPRSALLSLFTGTFTSSWYFGTMLNNATFLMLAGAGACIALKSGNMNLGGEGQIYLGGLVSALVLSSGFIAPLPKALALSLAFILSAFAGSAMACLSALLYEAKGATILLTTFLVSAASLPLIDGIITSKGGSSGQNLLALPYIAPKFRLAQLLPPSPFGTSFFVAIIICLSLYFVMTKTKYGKTITIWGKAPLFARFCGYSSYKNTFTTLAISGALHALAGMVSICGTYYTCHKGFYSGMGWNALSASLIVSSNPLALIPASVVLAWLYTSAARVGLTQGFGFDISGIVQGCILFAIAIPFSIEKISQTITDKKIINEHPEREV